MTEKKNKDFMRLLDSRVKPENDRKEEQGRSMTEMLGVLAIVGVLSVGGIAGYTYAMNKHYANELIMGASERAVLVTAQIASGREPSLREFDGIETVGGVFSGDVADDIADGFGITVSKVKGAVCENLKKMVEGTEVFIANDDTNLTEVSCKDTDNAFLFVYKNGFGMAGENGDQEKTHRSCNEWQCIDCPEGKEIVCRDGGVRCGCVTNPEDIDSWDCSDPEEGNLYCISCPDGQTPQCSEYGSGENACTCVSDDKEVYCTNYTCITCPDGQTAKCSTRGSGENACTCVSDDKEAYCTDYACITCPAGQTAQCSERGNGENACVCVPDSDLESENWDCGDRFCITCPAGQTAKCPELGFRENPCVCVTESEDEDSWSCGNHSCITCPDGQTAQCSEWGSGENACVCVTAPEDTDSWACGSSDCITCPDGQTAQCSDHDCICVQDGAKENEWACNDRSCITCPADEIARCFPCSCACVKEWRDDDPREEDYSCMEGE